MSTKTSPHSGASAAASASSTTSTTTPAAATTASIAYNSNSTGMHGIKIKKELPNDEIKEFAENTMNELLGWYGFDGVDRLDLSAKSSRLLHSAANTNNASMHHHHHMEKRRSRSRTATLLQMQQQSEHIRNMTNNHNNNNNNRKSAINCNNFRGNSSLSGMGSGGGGGGCNDSTTSDHDTRSSREDDSKSPHVTGKTTKEEKIDFQNCCWCRRSVPENAPEFLATTDGPRYCSESCFTQSRRASFKKAKTCDWCKHVRHAVSYVDFQDGASQLQFCSDKCLNQYKMQIFCKETQAHLDMNPHLRDQGLEAVAAGNGVGLITPDLWLRNCRSRSASPASTISVSPGSPAHVPSVMSMSSPRLTTPNHSVQSVTSTTSMAPGHKPVISVAPVSKLMSKSPNIIPSRQSPKHSRKKRPLRSCVGGDMTSGLKANNSIGVRDLCDLTNVGATAYLGKPKALHSNKPNNSLLTSPGHMVATNPSSLSQFAGSSVQDLHMSVPPLSPMMDHPMSHGTNVSVRGTSIPPAFFATTPQPPQTPVHMPSAVFPPRPPFMPNPAAAANAGLLPRFFGGFTGMQQPPHMMHPDLAGLSALLGAPPPPVTVMVPYPIIIPLPIPIPVPLPVMDFYKAYLTPAEREKLAASQLKSEEMQQRGVAETPVEEDIDQKAMGMQETADEPLDFTKSKDFFTCPDDDDDDAQQDTKNFNTPTNVSQHLNDDSLSLETVAEPTYTTYTPTEESSSSTTVTHCIVPADEPPANHTVTGDETIPKTPVEHDEDGAGDAQQRLPKFKITRLQTKRTLMQSKESECSRPLRKRKRIIDCDFQKIALKDAEADEHPQELSSTADAMESNTTASATSPPPPECNDNTKALNNKK